jgi:nucleoside-diphosphate-sugar epimerase
METLHHVHADDVAAAFMLALANKPQAVGQSFHVLSENALTFRGYAEAIADWYGQEAQLKFVNWEEFRESASAEDAKCTLDHLMHSSIGSIEKARRILHYKPRYSSLEAIKEALSWLEQEKTDH